MKAVRIHDYKQTPAIEEVPVPDIAENDVLIRVQAAALNPLDAHLASGFAIKFFPLTFPYSLGSDLAGTVERVGSAVAHWKPGDAVIAWPDPLTGGAVAEFAAVPAQACVPLPSFLSNAEGAAIPTAASTAWHALFTIAGLKAGETVLIHAGAGGIGTFAVQFAHKVGARVVATASGNGVELAGSLGADQVIDYKTEDFAAIVSNVDVVLDLVGGETQARSYRVLKQGGRLVSTTQPPDEADAASHGVKASIIYVKAYADRLREVVDAISTHGVKIVLDQTVPLAAFNDAWERQRSARARGKIVVSIS